MNYIIKKLKNTSSFSVDGIPCKYIRDASNILAPCITIIINTSIVTSIVPDIMKMAIVIHCIKSGKEKLPNYIPIPLLPILSIIMKNNSHKSILKISTRQ